jgi:hypothetical protein
VTRAQRRARLRTVIVCPGLMYGAGEDDEVMHPLMRRAWEVSVSACGGQVLLLSGSPRVDWDDACVGAVRSKV